MVEANNIFDRGPHVQVAAFCEKVLLEKDGVLSLIRLVDRIIKSERGQNPPDEMPEFHFPLHLVINLKCGSARGRHDITIIPEKPSGETLQPISLSINMEGEGKGVNIASIIDIPYNMEGLWWFRVLYDNQIITRLPLEVMYSKIVTGSASPT